MLQFAKPVLLAGYRALFEERNSFFITREEWAARLNDAYDDPNTARFCAARCKLWLEQKRAPVTPHLLMLALACASIGRPASVLDFGGGVGMTGLALREHFPESVSRYVVVETQPMADAAKAASIPFVEFQTEIPLDKFDIVLASGTLQCLTEPEQTLRKLVALRARKLLLLRNLFSAEQHYIRQTAPLHNHGQGPIPSGFEDRDVLHYLQSIDPTVCKAIIGDAYAVDFTVADTSGHPMRDARFIGEDWFCTLRPYLLPAPIAPALGA